MDLLRTYRLVHLEEGEGYIKLLVPKDFDPLVYVYAYAIGYSYYRRGELEG